MIRNIVTLGYGNGTFSPGVNKLPTLGYGIGVAIVPGSMVPVYATSRSEQMLFVSGKSWGG